MFINSTPERWLYKSRSAINKSSFSCVNSEFINFQHVVQTHADVTPEEIAELEANHAKCPVCHAVFRSMDIMRVHLRRHQVKHY